MRSINEIIKSAGGARAIEAASSGTIKADAVYKWPAIGIRDHHWPLIIRLANSSAEELYAANVDARGVAAGSEASQAGAGTLHEVAE